MTPGPVSAAWDFNGGGSYNDNSNWSPAGAPNSAGLTATFGNGVSNTVNTTPSLTVLIDGADVAGSLVFSNTNGTGYILGNDSVSGHGITLNNNGTGAAVNVSANTPQAILANLTLADNVTFNVNAGSSLSISGSLSQAGASRTLTMNGPGTLILGSANTYSGGTMINSGTLMTTASGALGSGPLTINGSGSTLDLGNTNQNVGAVSITAGTIQNGTLTATSFTVNNSAALTFPSTLILAGTGGLTKTNTGTLTLSDANTFSGGTTINSGTLTTTASGALGSGPLTISAPNVTSTLSLGASQTVSSLTSNQSGTGTASVNVAFGAKLTSTGPLSATGTLSLPGFGTTEIDGAPTLNNNSTLKLTTRGTLRFNATSGTATVGTGATVTIVAGGTLELAGSVSALSSGANRVNVTNTSIAAAGLLVSGANQRVGGIDGSGNTQVNAGSDLTANHIIQGALVIGGTSGSRGLVTIAASDAGGNPLGQSSAQPNGVNLASSLGSDGPFAAGINSAILLDASVINDSSVAGSSMTSSASGAGLAAVPEPSTLAIAACGLAVIAMIGVRRRQKLQTISMTTAERRLTVDPQPPRTRILWSVRIFFVTLGGRLSGYKVANESRRPSRLTRRSQTAS